MGCSSSSPAISRGDADHSAGPAAAAKNGAATLTTTRRSAGDWDVLARIDHASAPASDTNQPSSRPVGSAAAVAVRGEAAWNGFHPLSLCGGGGDDDNTTDSASGMGLFPFLPDVTPPLAAVGAAIPAVSHDHHAHAESSERPPALLGSPSMSAILLNDLQEGSQPSVAALSRSDVVLRRTPRSAASPPSPFTTTSPIAAGTAPLAQSSGGAVELPASVLMSVRWPLWRGGNTASDAAPPREATHRPKPPPPSTAAARPRLPGTPNR